MPSQSINLIPHSEIVEQRRRVLVHAGTIFFVTVFLAVIGVSGYFYFTASSLKSQIAEAEGKIETLRADISSLASIELSARALDARYKVVENIFKTRLRYSVLLSELEKRIPSNVIVSSFSMGGEGNTVISLTGSGQSYMDVSTFLSRLSDTNFRDASDELKPLFSNVRLNSVNLDGQNLEVSYYIVVSFNPELLR